MKKLIIFLYFFMFFIQFLYADSIKTKVAFLNGPTAVGGLKMIKELKNVDFTIVPSPDRLIAALIKGEFDIVAIPSNLGAIAYNRGLNYKAVAVIVESSFSIVSRDSGVHSLKDLKGKIIYCAAKGTNPDFMLQYMLKKENVKKVNINYSLSYPDLTKALISKVVDTAILVEPFTTMALDGKQDLKIAIDFSKTFKEPIGILIAKADFIEKNQTVLKRILKDYRSSTEYIIKNPKEIVSLIEGSGIIINANAVYKGIDRIGLNFYDGIKMKEKLDKYYKFLYDFNKYSIGGNIPKDNFYYIN